MCAVPGAAIRVGLIVGRAGKRTVHPATLPGRGRPVGRRTDKWVRELDAAPQPEQSLIDGGIAAAKLNSSISAARWSSDEVAERLGRGREEEQSSVRRKREDPT